MLRRPSIRIFGTRDATVQGSAAAFWLVLMLAVIVGGGPAVSGFPALMQALIPPGLIAAQAEGARASAEVELPLNERFGPSLYAPQLLTPVSSRALPNWLAARVARQRPAR